MKKLTTFDYLIGKEIGIERKTWIDLVESILDRRLYTQLNRMIKTGRKIIFIIEGKKHEAYKILRYYKRIPDPVTMAEKTVNRLILTEGVNVLYSENKQGTVELLKDIKEKSTEELIKITNKTKTRTSSIATVKMLMLVEGVGEKTAREIVKKLGRKITVYDEKKLLTVKGVGKKTAKSIVKFLSEVL